MRRAYSHFLLHLVSLPRVLGMIAMVVTLSACSQQLSGLHQWVEKTKVQPSGHIPSVPQTTPYKSYAFPAGIIRNPFNAGILLKQYYQTHRGKIKFNHNRPKQYLEDFPLDSLKMVGTLTDHGKTYALIQTPDGLIHWATSGNYIGEHGGKILEITNKGIRLHEIVPGSFGGYKEKIIWFALHK